MNGRREPVPDLSSDRAGLAESDPREPAPGLTAGDDPERYKRAVFY